MSSTAPKFLIIFKYSIVVLKNTVVVLLFLLTWDVVLVGSLKQLSAQVVTYADSASDARDFVCVTMWHAVLANVHPCKEIPFAIIVITSMHKEPITLASRILLELWVIYHDGLTFRSHHDICQSFMLPPITAQNLQFIRMLGSASHESLLQSNNPYYAKLYQESMILKARIDNERFAQAMGAMHATDMYL